MSDESAARQAIVAACSTMMRESEAAFLTTLDEDGAPCTRAVFNLRRDAQFPALRAIFQENADPLVVYVTTNTSSEKVRQIRREPRVSLYYCVPATIRGVMLSGRVTEITDGALKERIWQPGWEMYYPAGAHDPDYAVLELHPVRARGWLRGSPIEAALPARA